MSRWTREYNDDRSGSWVTKRTPVGEISVGFAPWLGGEDSPYTVTWWVGPQGDEVRVAWCKTEAAGKRAAMKFLRELAAKFAEAIS
jgi:hypothetical protein